MKEKVFKTGERCKVNGTYQCQKSRELQRYKRGDTFDYCPIGEETLWKRVD